MHVVRTVERVPSKFLEHISGKTGLYEIRVEHMSNIYRIFCCFDQGSIVVLFNAFHKKTQKTPLRQIEIAEKLMRQYFEKKEKHT